MVGEVSASFQDWMPFGWKYVFYECVKCGVHLAIADLIVCIKPPFSGGKVVWSFQTYAKCPKCHTKKFKKIPKTTEVPQV